MKTTNLILAIGILTLGHVHAQQSSINGTVVRATSYEPISQIHVVLEGTVFETISNDKGFFEFIDDNLPAGNFILNLSKPGFITLRIPIIIETTINKNLGLIPLQPDFFEEQIQIGTISLADNEMDEDEGSFDNVAGLLQATRDAYLNAAAFDFSATFFRPRGFDSEHGKVLINGLEMNKLFNGRPQWGNWGGLNDLQRNQVFSMGLSPSEVTFGGLAGSTNIIMRASKYRKGGRVSYALANRSYAGRMMASYSSGETLSGWSYSLLASRRYAEEGYVEGTVYDANSIFLSIEKKINNSHSINFSGIYTPNLRGKSSANTQEVLDIKGNRYNSFWGFQDGKIRNSRVRDIQEPILMLNHFWNINSKIELNTNVAYQFGKIGNTRIDFGGTRLSLLPDGQESFIGGGSNPDPVYYQNLPSYFLRFNDNQNFEGAFRAQQELVNNGQLNWNKLYEANETTVAAGGNSTYVLAEDRNDDKQVQFNSILSAEINEAITFNAMLKYTQLKSENFASIKDLLGGTGYLDVDFFAEATNDFTLGDVAQSDLQNRNRIARQGERYKYNFELHAKIYDAFAQAQFNYQKVDFYTSVTASNTQYYRNGIFQNGNFPNNSLGQSETLNFLNLGFKTGGTYKFSGRHLFNFNAAYFTKAPNLRNSFSNSRQNNDVVIGLQNEKIKSLDASYYYRTSTIKTRFTGYYTEIHDATEISFYYADGLSGLGRNSTTAFVQEVLSGIDKQHLGLEIGAEAQVTSTIKLKAAAGVGQFIYQNNPNLYLTSDDFSDVLDYGKSFLKNYRVAGGPQQAAQLGFEYRDPAFWWFGTTVNFFSHGFADVSPLTRTNNFAIDGDGFPISNYNETKARQLLKQEQFDDYILVNAIGGKSWMLKGGYYLGFFVSLNNIFNVLYKTGGFEQARNANYNSLTTDRDREYPLFNNRYWYGTGSTYYANIYVRF